MATDEKSGDDIKVNSGIDDSSLKVTTLCGNKPSMKVIKADQSHEFLAGYHDLLLKYSISSNDPFLYVYSRGITPTQMNDIINAEIKLTAFMTDSLHILKDGSMMSSNINLTVKNGVIGEYSGFDPKWADIREFLPKFKQAGIKYVGFDIATTPNSDGDNTWYNLKNVLDPNNTTPSNNAIKAEIYKNFEALIKFGVNYFDSDYELFDADYQSTSLSEYVDTHVELFSSLYTKFGIDTFSCSPYSGTPADTWIEIGKKLYSKTNVCLLKWANLQTYGGSYSGTWYPHLYKMDVTTGKRNYELMGLTPDEALVFCKDTWEVNRGQTVDALMYLIDRMRGETEIDSSNMTSNAGGAGIWLIGNVYPSDGGGIITDGTFNWADMYFKAMKQGLLPKSSMSIFLQNYQSKWQCITQGLSYGYTYCIINEKLLVSNNKGYIRLPTIADITKEQNGFTWVVPGGQWKHQIDPKSGHDYDAYNNGIYWAKRKPQWLQ